MILSKTQREAAAARNSARHSHKQPPPPVIDWNERWDNVEKMLAQYDYTEGDTGAEARP
jgi:hypothetical protein